MGKIEELVRQFNNVPKRSFPEIAVFLAVDNVLSYTRIASSSLIMKKK